MNFHNCWTCGSEVIPGRAWAGLRYDDFGDCVYCNVFDAVKVKDCDNNRFGTFAMGGALKGLRGINLIASVFASIVEKKFLARYGDMTCEMNGLPTLCNIPSGRFAYAFRCSLDENCKVEWMKDPRRFAREYLDDAVKLLLHEYADAETKTGPFGSIFPDCPHHADDMPCWDNPDYVGLCTIVGFFNCEGVLRDITQRAHCRDEDNCATDAFPCILGTGNLVLGNQLDPRYRPAYKHAIGILSGLLTAYDTELADYLNRNTEISPCACGYTCTLKCWGEDLMLEWSKKLDELRRCGYITQCVPDAPRYSRMFGRGCRPITQRRYNPFVMSLALALLGSFDKFQVTNQCVAMGNVTHKWETLVMDMWPEWCGEDDKWKAKTQFGYDSGESVVAHTSSWAFGVTRLCTMSLGWGYRKYADIKVLKHPCTSCDVYCYYGCHGWDGPYSTLTQSWTWRSQGECHMNHALMTAYRRRACGNVHEYGDRNKIGLTWGSQQFPNLCSPAVLCRLKRARNHQIVRRDFGYDASNYDNAWCIPMFKLLKYDYDGVATCNWVRDRAFCMYNNEMEGQCAGVYDKMHAFGYCRYTGFDSSWGYDYFGFGEGGIAEMETKLEGLGEPGSNVDWKFDRVRFDPGTNKWFGGNYWGGTWIEDEIRTDSEVVGFYYMGCSSACVSWSPHECGNMYNKAFDVDMAKANIVFGGYFQIVEWDFDYLKRDA